jgi:hypothetical protein
VRTTLEGLVTGVDDHAGRIASDVEVDLTSVHGGDGNARQGLQTVCQVALCHEQVGARSTGLAPLSRVHPDERVPAESLGLREHGDELRRQNPTVRPVERLAIYAGSAAQLVAIQSELPQRSQEIRGLEATHGRLGVPYPHLWLV